MVLTYLLIKDYHRSYAHRHLYHAVVSGGSFNDGVRNVGLFTTVSEDWTDEYHADGSRYNEIMIVFMTILLFLHMQVHGWVVMLGGVIRTLLVSLVKVELLHFS